MERFVWKGLCVKLICMGGVAKLGNIRPPPAHIGTSQADPDCPAKHYGVTNESDRGGEGASSLQSS
jgi:hypothetical protein